MPTSDSERERGRALRAACDAIDTWRERYHFEIPHVDYWHLAELVATNMQAFARGEHDGT